MYYCYCYCYYKYRRRRRRRATNMKWLERFKEKVSQSTFSPGAGGPGRPRLSRQYSENGILTRPRYTHPLHIHTHILSLSLSQIHEKPRKVFRFPHVDQQNGESLFLGLLHRKFLPSSSKFLLSFLRVFGTCIQGCIL